MTETAGMLLWRLTQTTTYREAQADEQVALFEAAFAREAPAAERRALLAESEELIAAAKEWATARQLAVASAERREEADWTRLGRAECRLRDAVAALAQHAPPSLENKP